MRGSSTIRAIRTAMPSSTTAGSGSRRFATSRRARSSRTTTRTSSRSATRRRQSAGIPAAAVRRSAAGRSWPENDDAGALDRERRRRSSCEPVFSSFAAARPHVVVAIGVDDAVVGIDLDLAHSLASEIVESVVEGRVRAPDFGRIGEVLRRSVAEGEANAKGQHAARVIAEPHADRIDLARLFLDERIDADVEVWVLEEPLAEEPVESLAAHVLHGLEEIRRAGMLERPAARVLAERLVERLRSQDLVAELREAHRRLHVGILAEQVRVDAVRLHLERLVVVVLHELLDRGAVPGHALLVAALLGESP